MSRADDIEARDRKIARFIRDVEATAARLKTQNLTLVAVAFCFGLLLEILEKIAAYTGGLKSELYNAREKWTGDK